MIPFQLSSAGLSYVERLSSVEYFTFIAGGSKYVVPRALAVFLSPKVFKIVKDNATNLTLTLKTSDNNKVFDDIIKLASGSQIYINEKNIDTLFSFAKELENTELMEICHKKNHELVFKSPITLENAIRTIRSKIKAKMNIDNDISFIAERFFDFTPKSLHSLDPDTLYRIISDENLQIRTESKLFAFIYNIVRDCGESYFRLYDLVRFNELSDSEMKLFVDSCNITNINETIWKSICSRFSKTSNSSLRSPKREKLAVPVILPHDDLTVEVPITEEITQLPKSPKKKKSSESHEYKPSKDDILSGGIFGSIPVLKGKVALSSSSKNTGFISLLLKNGNNTNFWTHNEPNSWIRIDFKTIHVKITGYTLQGRCDHDYNQMQSWVLEVMVNKHWVAIDTVSGKALNKSPMYFPCAKNDYEVKTVRIRQTGPNTYGDDDLVLSRMELFGFVL